VTAPGPPGQTPAPPDPELVLAQALRAMAGGGKAARADRSPDQHRSAARLTTVQVLLIAALVGLGAGITAGLISLLS
jgi:hypothetical protein